MIINYFKNMTNNEKIYLLIVIILIITLVLFFIKFKKRNKKSFYKNKEKQAQLGEIIEPITIPDQPIKKEVNSSKIELDSVLEQMRNSLEEKQQDVVRTFEEEQEEKSIISYQELLRVNQKEVEPEKVEEKTIQQDEQFISSESVNKFRNSEIISPIYGRIDTDIEYPTIPKIRRAKLNDEDVPLTKEIKDETPIEVIDDVEETKEEKPTSIVDLEKTISTDNLKEEMLKNEKFLNALRDFRKNLE